MALLEVSGLKTQLFTRRGVNKAVDGVSFNVDTGRSLGIVGESGSGKSMTALSILRLTPKPYAKIVAGSIRFNGEELLDKSDAEMRAIRGSGIAIILQDPMTSLNPVFTVGFQIGEAVTLHQHLRGTAKIDEVIASLHHVRMPSPETRMVDYPHQFSGGMRQRVVGAVAIACKPRLLIADEATTALDATIQAQYLSLLRSLQRELNLACLFITHDFGIVAQMCDDVAVMYAGRIVEHAEVQEIFNRPSHPYTISLFEAVPKIDRRADRLYAIPGSSTGGYAERVGCPFADRCAWALPKCHVERPPAVEVAPGHASECWRAEELHGSPGKTELVQTGRQAPAAAVQPARADRLLEIVDLHVSYSIKRGSLFDRQNVMLKAVDGVTFEIRAGETVSVVGESGCGKSTMARAILKIQAPTRGAIMWQGKSLADLDEAETRAFRAAVQAVLQDPYSSMNPRQRVGRFIVEPLMLSHDIDRTELRARGHAALQTVGLRGEDIDSFPHEFSGGQRQRIAIARAIASSPRLIVLDEPVSSLDVSIRAQIMNLLKDLQQRQGFSYLFIAHHLGTVRYMSQMVVVMYLGRLMEMAESEELFNHPLHPYTQALLSAALPDHPDVARRQVVLQNDVAAATDIPRGCRLHPRCPAAMAVCSEIEPRWKEVAPKHWVACHLH